MNAPTIQATSVLLALLCLPAQALEWGAVTPKGTLDGIPMHTISVKDMPHDQVDIRLDGKVDEAIWETLPAYDNMLVAIPGTGEPSTFPTATRFLATEKGLYVSAVMSQPKGTLVRRMANRDEFIDRDTFGVTLDTTGAGLFAYWFIIALGDTVMDGKVLPERRYANDWDGPWTGATAETDSGWSTELFFPWSMMNIPNVNGRRQIGFALSRQVAHANQRVQWPGHAYSSPQFVTALNTLEVDNVRPRQQFSIIPYASATLDEARDRDDYRAGFDVTWKPTPRFEVNATVNPDFGSVEADDVVVNFSRSEVFFPEKRLFFLEGNEIFETSPRSNSGTAQRLHTNENYATTSRRVFMTDWLPTPISILNTRRIGGVATQVALPAGVTPDPGETALPTELLGAAKFSGNFGGLRYAVLGASENDVEWYARDATGNPLLLEADGRDFGIGRLIWEGSNAAVRYGLGGITTQIQGPLFDASVYGIDGHFGTNNGRWAVDVQAVRSEVDDRGGDGRWAEVLYAPSSNIAHTVKYDYFDRGVRLSDMGFLRRNDYEGLQYILQYTRNKAMGPILNSRGAITVDVQRNLSKHQFVEKALYWRNIAILPGRLTLRTGVGVMPARYEDFDTRGNGSYRTHDRVWLDTLWATDASKPASWSFGVGGWQEHLGDWTYQLSTGVTLRPIDSFYMDFDLKYRHRQGWLVYQGGRNFGAYYGKELQPSVKATWFLAARHQVRLSLQWAGVRVDERGFYGVPVGDGKLIPTARTRPNHDFNVALLTTQLRYRWEIAPLTDLYLVYTRGNQLNNVDDDAFDNLFTESFSDPIVDFFVVKLRWRFGT
ncbi:MAG: hypothetical protein H6993_13335 [Pseudomonadales bacterium]|nr:hypothetical protein [Pseudomonadales bacterium]